jgi:hypothetical protein
MMAGRSFVIRFCEHTPKILAQSDGRRGRQGLYFKGDSKSYQRLVAPNYTNVSGGHGEGAESLAKGS